MRPPARAAAGCVLWLAAFASSNAVSAQLFKCIEGGRTVYQQQACSVTSEAEPAASAAAKAAAASAPAAKAVKAAQAEGKIKPASPPASPATPR